MRPALVIVRWLKLPSPPPDNITDQPGPIWELPMSHSLTIYTCSAGLEQLRAVIPVLYCSLPGTKSRTGVEINETHPRLFLRQLPTLSRDNRHWMSCTRAELI